VADTARFNLDPNLVAFWFGDGALEDFKVSSGLETCTTFMVVGMGFLPLFLYINANGLKYRIDFQSFHHNRTTMIP
jgi:hypothetical protein